MAHFDAHAPGSFCLFELSAHSPAAAKAFYSSLFGWQSDDNPNSPVGIYTMFQLEGRDVAGAYTQLKVQTEAGFPSYWDVYIAVTSADETAAKAVELGGKLAMPLFDVAGYGRMAVIVDPTGVAFCIWQAKTHIGIQVKNEPGSFCWVDFVTPNQEAAVSFYSGLFGWNIDSTGDYRHVRNGQDFLGGIRAARPGERARSLKYVQVADCSVATEKARELGAKVFAGPLSAGESGTMSVLADPQGAVFALFEITHSA